MIKVTEYRGETFLELDGHTESVTDHHGIKSFIKLSDDRIVYCFLY